jgi:DNA mismatch repair protein MutS
MAVDEINATTPGASIVASLIADVDDDEDSTTGPHHHRTFRIHPGVPRGRSLASEIARRYGISFSQLAVLLAERGIAAENAHEGETDSSEGHVTSR